MTLRSDTRNPATSFPAATQQTALSRREVLGTAIAAGVGIALGGCSSAQPGPVTITPRTSNQLDPRVLGLIRGMFSIDMHTHAAGANSISPVLTYDLADHMRRGGMTAVCLCHAADAPVLGQDPVTMRPIVTRAPNPGELWAHTLRRLDFIDSAVNAGKLHRVMDPDSLIAAKTAGRPALISNIEGCQFLEGKIERVQTVFDRGVRMLQPIHYLLDPQLGDEQTALPVVDGLGPLGRNVVSECNRLGIVVDMAHATFDATVQAARIGPVPFILSHTSLAPGTPAQFSRRISSDHARVVSRAGGVIGVWPSSTFFSTPEEWIEGIAKMVDVTGTDYVGIGTDFEGGVPDTWSDYADLPTVVDLMLKHGFAPKEVIQIMGGNFMRVFRAAWNARTA